MSRRRFSDLEGRLLSFLQSGGSRDVSQIQDQELRKYAEWKFNQGGDKRKLPASSTRNRQGLKYAIIEPFGDLATPSKLFLASVSERARAWLATQPAALKTAVAWKPAPADTSPNQPIFVKGFISARAVIRQQAASADERTSRITGKKYKTKAGSTQQGYSIPFGSAGDNSEIVQARAINDAVPNATFSVSFLPERYVKAPELATL
jgi:hypothetical protein